MKKPSAILLLPLMFILMGLVSPNIVVIDDIDGWEHPAKAVFLLKGIEVNKVVLTNNKTYPFFYVTFPKYITGTNKRYFDDLTDNIAKANAYWDYEIVDSEKNIQLKVTCNRQKQLITNRIYDADEKIKFDAIDLLKDAGIGVSVTPSDDFSVEYLQDFDDRNNNIYLITQKKSDPSKSFIYLIAKIGNIIRATLTIDWNGDGYPAMAVFSMGCGSKQELALITTGTDTDSQTPVYNITTYDSQLETGYERTIDRRIPGLNSVFFNIVGLRSRETYCDVLSEDHFEIVINTVFTKATGEICNGILKERWENDDGEDTGFIPDIKHTPQILYWQSNLKTALEKQGVNILYAETQYDNAGSIKLHVILPDWPKESLENNLKGILSSAEFSEVKLMDNFKNIQITYSKAISTSPNRPESYSMETITANTYSEDEFNYVFKAPFKKIFGDKQYFEVDRIEAITPLSLDKNIYLVAFPYHGEGCEQCNYKNIFVVDKKLKKVQYFAFEWRGSINNAVKYELDDLNNNRNNEIIFHYNTTSCCGDGMRYDEIFANINGEYKSIFKTYPYYKATGVPGTKKIYFVSAYEFKKDPKNNSNDIIEKILPLNEDDDYDTPIEGDKVITRIWKFNGEKYELDKIYNAKGKIVKVDKYKISDEWTKSNKQEWTY